MFSMREPPETRRRMYPREEDDWSDHYSQQYYGPSLSVLPNRKIGPALNESPSRPRGELQVVLYDVTFLLADNITIMS